MSSTRAFSDFRGLASSTESESEMIISVALIILSPLYSRSSSVSPVLNSADFHKYQGYTAVATIPKTNTLSCRMCRRPFIYDNAENILQPSLTPITCKADKHSERARKEPSTLKSMYLLSIIKPAMRLRQPRHFRRIRRACRVGNNFIIKVIITSANNERSMTILALLNFSAGNTFRAQRHANKPLPQ